MKFGIGDTVRILHCSNMTLIGKTSKIASICGSAASPYYHLKIDGEERAFHAQNLQLVKKNEESKL